MLRKDWTWIHVDNLICLINVWFELALLFSYVLDLFLLNLFCNNAFTQCLYFLSTFPFIPDPTQVEEDESLLFFFMKHGSHFCEDIINFINLIKVDSLRHDTMTSKKVWNKASVVLNYIALFFDNMMQHGAKQKGFIITIVCFIYHLTTDVKSRFDFMVGILSEFAADASLWNFLETFF